MSVDSNFSEVYGSISLNLARRKSNRFVISFKMAAIFDVNTAITWRTSPGFHSNLVQRLYRRGNMHALHSLISFKSGDRVAIFAFLPPILRVNPTKHSWYRPVVFCSSSNCYTNFYTFSAELYRLTGLVYFIYLTSAEYIQYIYIQLYVHIFSRQGAGYLFGLTPMKFQAYTL